MENSEWKFYKKYAFSGNQFAPKSAFSHPVFSGGGVKTPHF